jgi:predicted dinucleotide-binding enzyme
MTKSLAIVGPGRVGRALGRRLRETGWKITVVAGRTEASAKKGTRFIGAGRPAAGVPATLAAASIILIAVPDDVIDFVAVELSRVAGASLRGKVVLHTSGPSGLPFFSRFSCAARPWALCTRCNLSMA